MGGRTPPSFGVKLARPGFGPPAEPVHHRQCDGVTAVAVRHSVLRTSLAATAAPLQLRHAGRPCSVQQRC